MFDIKLNDVTYLDLTFYLCQLLTEAVVSRLHIGSGPPAAVGAQVRQRLGVAPLCGHHRRHRHGVGGPRVGMHYRTRNLHRLQHLCTVLNQMMECSHVTG